MIPLKNNYTYLVLDSDGQISLPEENDDVIETGAFLFDTRVLNKYKWQLDSFSLLHYESIGSSKLIQYYSSFENHKQSLLIKRELSVKSNGFVDKLTISNDDIEAHEFVPDLHVDSDFCDMFEVRGFSPTDFVRDVVQSHTSSRYRAHYVDLLENKTEVSIELSNFKFNEVFKLEANESLVIQVNAEFRSELPEAEFNNSVPVDWLGGSVITTHQNIYSQAESDLKDLLLSTKDGVTIAAGIPWFVTPFGRDSIITSWFLLEKYPDLAKGTLQFLAENQGNKVDEVRDELPGKILHEKRFGEHSRVGKLPFSTYYGTADATPLFICLLHDYCEHVDDYALMHELKSNWLAASDWLEKYQDNNGLIIFKGNDKGLTVQSWKDSHDSLSYSNGKLGSGALAVAEVQGYCYAAYQSIATFYDHLNEPDKVEYFRDKADSLKQKFNELFWMEKHHNYAIALDEDFKQLDVNSSDSGHLLWSGIVDDEKINTLVDRLFQPDMWTGNGLRTLSTSEKRYNPLSYHNGSVWPHDTGIFAAGLKKYGKEEEFNLVRKALIQVASSQKDKRLPELYSGYDKSEAPVLPYLEACRPQAWSSAALIYLMSDD